MSFVRPRKLMSFDPRHVTNSPPIENVFELGGVTKHFVFFASCHIKHPSLNVILRITQPYKAHAIVYILADSFLGVSLVYIKVNFSVLHSAYSIAVGVLSVSQAVLLVIVFVMLFREIFGKNYESHCGFIFISYSSYSEV